MDPAASTFKAKRRRIALACTQCRSRKTKCNGAQPVCASCASNGFLCVYDPGSSEVSPLMIRNEDFQALVLRVSSLEAQVQRLKTTSPAGTTADDLGASSNEQHRSTDPVQSSLALAQAPGPGPTRSTSDHHNHHPGEREGVDGMGIVYEIGQLPAYYGSASTAYLTEALLAAVPENSRQDTRGDTLQRLGHGQLQRDQPDLSSTAARVSKQHHFPSLQDSRYYLDTFEREIWPTYPIVPTALLREIQQSFQDRNPSSLHDLQQLALLKSVFALSAAFCGQEADGAAYFQSAADQIGGSVSPDSGDSLWQVCTLIYSVLYLQSTDRPSPAWHTIGRAIRICLALGYHTDRPHLKAMEEIHSEVACRAWYACLNIDRFVSMSLGRPSSIQSPAPLIRLPRPVTDEAPNQLQYLISCTFLSNILARILTALYLDNSGPSLSDQTRESCEQDLLVWRHQLPPHLDVRQYSAAAAAPQDAIMLALRFHTTYMLVHRYSVQEVIRLLAQKGFAAATDGMFNPNCLPYNVASSLSCCISAAVETVDILNRVKDVSDAHKGGASWYRLFYTYNAFIILVTAVLALDANIYLPPRSLPRDDRVKKLASCEDCERLIEELAKSSRSAQRCLAVVQQLLARVKATAHSTAAQQPPPASAPAAVYDFDFGGTLEDIKKWMDIDAHSTAGPMALGQSEDRITELDDAFGVFSGDLAWLAQQ